MRACSVASHNLKRAFCSLELQISSAPYSAFTAAETGNPRESAIPRAAQWSSQLPHSRNTAGSWHSCLTHLTHHPHSSKAGDWAPVVNGLLCHVVIFMLWIQATSCGLHSSRSRKQHLSQTGSLHHLPHVSICLAYVSSSTTSCRPCFALASLFSLLWSKAEVSACPS